MQKTAKSDTRRRLRKQKKSALPQNRENSNLTIIYNTSGMSTVPENHHFQTLKPMKNEQKNESVKKHKKNMVKCTLDTAEPTKSTESH